MNPDFRKAVRMDSFSAKVANAGQIAFTNLTPGAYNFERLKTLAIGDSTVSPDWNVSRAAQSWAQRFVENERSSSRLARWHRWI